LSLVLIMHRTLKAYGVSGIAPLFLDIGLDGGEWSFSLLGRFTPMKDPPVSTGQKDGWATGRSGPGT
jgi:hypothetical protein